MQALVTAAGPVNLMASPAGVHMAILHNLCPLRGCQLHDGISANIQDHASGCLLGHLPVASFLSEPGPTAEWQGAARTGPSGGDGSPPPSSRPPSGLAQPVSITTAGVTSISPEVTSISPSAANSVTPGGAGIPGGAPSPLQPDAPAAAAPPGANLLPPQVQSC